MTHHPLPEYAELHCLSNFSFQRGASSADELVKRAHQLGYTALAVTDECSLAGIVRAWVAAEEVGLKLIVGAEFILFDGMRLVLLAPDREAYGDLSELISHGRRQADKGSYSLARSDLAALSGRLLALWLPGAEPDAAEGHWLAAQYPDRAWLAVELLHGPACQQRLKQLRALGRLCHLPCVAAGDVHMHVRSRRVLQDLLTAVRLGKPVADCGFALFPNGERHLRSLLSLSRLYPAEMLAETVRIAERCRLNLRDLRFEYADELVPAGHTPTSHLAALTEVGLKRRYPAGVPNKVEQQVQAELALIAKLRYEPFFLTVEDVVRFARGQNILCQGRGSAANSAVCYALHITEVDPNHTNLLFERFLSEARDEPPDIDVDFEHERREEVIQYIYKKYGRDRTAIAATVISYRPRSALRDMARALGFDETQVERLGKTLAWWDKPSELVERLAEAGFDANAPKVRLLQWAVLTLLRFPRHLSQHVGGFIISRGPLARLVPIENAAMKDRTVIQWDKDDLEAMQLLKVDVLALGMLTAIRRSFDLVAAFRQQPPWTMATIPKEVSAVYEMICRADTVGVFQIESRAQMSMLPRLRPVDFYDLVIEVAIVRPGPIQGDMVHPYLQRREAYRRGQRQFDFQRPEVAKVLSRTLGIPIFQEQVMALSVACAGFTATEADQLRRSMASWRQTGTLDKFRQKLKDGMLERGYAQAFIDRILKQIEGFAEYGFPESHAASFALLVYVSAWLKCHEPAAFCCALINSQPMGFYSPAQLVQDAQRHGVAVRPVCVQRSGWDCTLEADETGEPAIRLGLRLIDGLGGPLGKRIEMRRPVGGYGDVGQLQRLAELDRRALDALARSDALVALSGHRRLAQWAATGLGGHADLTEGLDDDDALADLPAASLANEIVDDYASTGLSLRAHPWRCCVRA
jgi:error-prone DNA polymerase